MQTSVFIARLLGPILLAIGIGLVVDRRGYRGMAQEFLASRALIYLAGLIALTAGLAIVLVHNVWVLGWPVIITVFGWLAVIGGVIRIVLPGRAAAIGARVLDSRRGIIAAGAAYTAIGAVLTAIGFLA